MFRFNRSSCTAAVSSVNATINRSHTIRILPFFWLSLLLFSTNLFAQQFTGRVTDTSGAAIPKASITVLNQQTGVAIKTLSTGTGDYTVPYLKPGLYTVTAEARGFNKEARTDITLQVGQSAKIDFQLNVGSITETVTVVSDKTLLADRGDVGEVVENTRVTELPLNGGDPTTLSQLSAGANWYGSRQYLRPFDDNEADLSINGGGTGNNALTLDGVSNEAAKGDAYNGTNSQIGYVPPVSAVQEFKIVTNPYDAQYGRASGGVIDISLKSGTNLLHGSVYEYARRGYLDANSWQNNYYGTPRTGQKRDQYGAELDGPLILPKLYNGRNRTFFLLQFENFKSVEPGTAVSSVPLPGWSTGDFSNLVYYDGTTGSYQPDTIYDPLSLHYNAAGVPLRDPFPGNVIPSGRLSAFAQKFMSYFPAPNLPPSAGQNPWTDDYSAPSQIFDTYRNALAKIDQNISSRDRLTLRWGYWIRFEDQNQSGIPGPGARGEFPHAERSNTFATDWVHTFNPDLLFDFRSSVIVRGNHNNTGPAGFDLTTLGLPSTSIQQLGIFNDFLPYLNPGEYTPIGNNGGQYSIGNSLALLPMMTWVKGAHTMHFGLDWRILQSSYRYVEGGMQLAVDRTWTQANYQQGDAASGNSFASLLLGTAQSGNVQINPTVFWSQHYYAPFFQDDWKITPRLTLNLGIRYDLNEPPIERHNRADYAFDTTVVNPVNSQIDSALLPPGVGELKGGLTFVGVNGNPRPFYSATKTDVQPRFGFAYQFAPDTVVHGGVGILYRNPDPGANQYGFSSTTQYVGSLDGGKTPTENLGVGGVAPNPFPVITQPAGSSQGYLTALGQGQYFINPHYRTPQFQTFSLGVQQRYAKNGTFELNYVGTRTYHNDSSDNINHVSEAAYAQCNILLGGNPAVCNTAPGSYIPNPFYNVAPFQGTGYYSSPTIQALNFTRPFPLFSDLTEYQLNNGRSWYNALQLTVVHRMGRALTLHGTWTWSKSMDSGGFTDTVYRIPARNIDSNDITHRVTISGVWMLPVGRGQYFFSHMNRIADTILGGWQLGSLYIYESGKPWTVNNNPIYLGGAWQPQHTNSAKNVIYGVRQCVGQYNEQSNGQYVLQPYENTAGCNGTYDFINNPQYAPATNINYTGVRTPGWYQLDANLAKDFHLYERLGMQLRLDAFNVPNHPAWQQQYDQYATDATFGEIVKNSVGQSNIQRQVQLTAKITW